MLLKYTVIFLCGRVLLQTFISASVQIRWECPASGKTRRFLRLLEEAPQRSTRLFSFVFRCVGHTLRERDEKRNKGGKVKYIYFFCSFYFLLDLFT